MVTMAALSATCLLIHARYRQKYRQQTISTARDNVDSRKSARVKKLAGETLVLSVGSTCLTAHVLGTWGVRRFASPFDWLFTTPEVVAHVVASDGEALLDPLQLFKVENGGAKVAHALYTPMLLDATRRCSNHRRVNKQGVIFNHHDPMTIADDRAYFTRALCRLRAALASPLPKLCILISAERRLAISDDELDVLLATLAKHSTPTAPLELVAVRLHAPRSAGVADAMTAAPRLRCRRVRTEQHASLRCMDLSCRAGFTDSGLALSDAADMLDLAQACFGSEASLDARGRLVAAISSAADPSAGLKTDDNDHVKPCGKMSAGWTKSGTQSKTKCAVRSAVKASQLKGSESPAFQHSSSLVDSPVVL